MQPGSPYGRWRARALLVAAPGVLAPGACARRGTVVAGPTPSSASPISAPVPPATPTPRPDPGAAVSPPNSGPTLFIVTLYGAVSGSSARAVVVDSVVVLPERPGCADGGMLRFEASAPVTAEGAFGLTVRTQAPRACLRLVAVRAGRWGPATDVRVGPLAPRYNGSPAALEDSVRITVAAPP